MTNFSISSYDTAAILDGRVTIESMFSDDRVLPEGSAGVAVPDASADVKPAKLSMVLSALEPAGSSTLKTGFTGAERVVLAHTANTSIAGQDMLAPMGMTEDMPVLEELFMF